MISDEAMQAAIEALTALRDSEDYFFTSDEVVVRVVLEAAEPYMK